MRQLGKFCLYGRTVFVRWPGKVRVLVAAFFHASRINARAKNQSLPGCMAYCHAVTEPFMMVSCSVR